MKSLSYFEKEVDKLRATTVIDYKLVSRAELILNLMKRYRVENNIAWLDYKKVYDKWFAKYHS